MAPDDNVPNSPPSSPPIPDDTRALTASQPASAQSSSAQPAGSKPADSKPAGSKPDSGTAAAITPPTRVWEIFTGFLEIGLYGFGGVGASARYIIIDKRKWMNSEDYLALMAVSQVLPGGNIVNASVILGDRFLGVPGALAGLTGILLAPLLIVGLLGIAYDRFGALPWVQAVAIGGGAAAAGLIIGTGLRLGRSISPTLTNIAVGLVSFVALGVLKVPLPIIVVIMIPASIGLAIWGHKR